MSTTEEDAIRARYHQQPIFNVVILGKPVDNHKAKSAVHDLLKNKHQTHQVKVYIVNQKGRINMPADYFVESWIEVQNLNAMICFNPNEAERRIIEVARKQGVHVKVKII